MIWQKSLYEFFRHTFQTILTTESSGERTHSKQYYNRVLLRSGVFTMVDIHAITPFAGCVDYRCWNSTLCYVTTQNPTVRFVD